ncbi:MAG: ribonuclease P protein component [Deltaproteobacteria bacterium]|nr:ribonuclease P protein component [Deltaproteobacteria bacterium]
MTARPTGRGFALPKESRLLKRREYLRLKGARGASKAGLGDFTVVCAPNGLGRNRLGITATRKSGNAVARNRLKREAREFFRLRSPFWPQGLDVLFLARPGPRKGPPLSELHLGEAEAGLVKALRRSLASAAPGRPRRSPAGPRGDMARHDRKVPRDGDTGARGGGGPPGQPPERA